MPDTLMETTYTKNDVVLHSSRVLVNSDGERTEAPAAEETAPQRVSGGGGAMPAPPVTPLPATEDPSRTFAPGGGMSTTATETDEPAAPAEEEIAR